MANNNWAVVIGINDYKYHPERRLKYAVRDAQLMHDFLGEHGFQPEQVILCLGDREHQESPTYPTCAYLVNLLARELAPEQVGEVSRFWFFFSGHGVSPDGRDYLLTCDSLAANIEKFALPVDDVIAYLRRHEKAEIVLILDMCRQLVGEKGMDSEIGKQTLAFAKEQSVTTIFSCDYRQSSYENSSLQHGSFTYALVEGLKQHTIPAQLEPYLQQQVRELNRQDHKPVEQKPIIRPEPGAKYLQPLLPECATEADIAALMETAENAELEENYEKAERLLWQVIEITSSKAVRASAHDALKRIERKKAHIQQSHAVVVTGIEPSEGKSASKSKTVRRVAIIAGVISTVLFVILYYWPPGPSPRVPPTPIPTLLPTSLKITFLGNWGSEGKGDGQFLLPWGIGVSWSVGTVYVGDHSQASVQVFSSSGRFLGKLPGKIMGPRLAVDSNGLIYAMNYDPGTGRNQRIEIFSYGDHNLMRSFNLKGSAPRAIDVDIYGKTIYVTDIGEQKVYKYGPNGEVLAEWGAGGDGNGQFRDPWGVAVDRYQTGRIYVADTGNNRVQVFDSNGRFLKKWGMYGTGDGQFNSPIDIAVDTSRGNIYVLDSKNARVQVFNPEGKFLGKWGSVGRNDGQFLDPYGIVIDGNDNVYILDTGNYRVQVFKVSFTD